MSTTNKKALPSLDDLLSDDASTLGISKDALKDLAKLDAQMRKSDTGEPRVRVDEGKPVRVLIFMTRAECKCGATYEYPSYQCAMLKRVFHGSTLRAIYTPHPSRNAFFDLPHETEVTLTKLMSCPACFDKRETQLAPRMQHVCCLFCSGDHELHECPVGGHKEYAEALHEERQAYLKELNKEPNNEAKP